MSAAPTSAGHRALLVAIVGSSMAFLDGTVVNVALPVMQRDLGMTIDSAQWVVEAYALFLASLVLVGGTLGDRYGRKRVFLAGVVLFSLASATCGAAPSALFLIVARAVQGVGGALLVPGSLSLISAAYPDEHARGRAIGTWSSFSAITAAVGPVAGGWVVSHASWRWLFYFNAPIAVLVLLLARRGIVETRDESAPRRMDWAGASMVTIGLGLVVYGLIDSGKVAGAAGEIVLIVTGLVTLVAFVLVEARRAEPMVPLALFRSRTFAGTNLVTLLLYGALGAAMFFVPFDLIHVQRYSPAAAGASLLPFVLLVSGMSPAAGAIAARIGPRIPLVIGPLVTTCGFVALAVPHIGGSYWTTFFPGVVLVGLGMGATVAPLTSAVMESVERRHAGLASGVNNAVSRAAGLLAIAVLGVVLRSRFDGALDAHVATMNLPPSVAATIAAERDKLGGTELGTVEETYRAPLRAAFADAFVTGFRTTMIACAVLTALGAAAAFVSLRKSPMRQ
ncbi:MAG: putative transrane efflux protein [Labilithrix sp.]|nr:putative transrane efflux protein [Labilithrix sp.]